MEAVTEQRVGIEPVGEADDPGQFGPEPKPDEPPKKQKVPTAYLVLAGKKTEKAWYEVGVFNTNTKREAKAAALNEDSDVQALYEDRNLKIVAVPARSWDPTEPEPQVRIRGL